LQHLTDASAASLLPFIEDSIEPRSLLHTDGWRGYASISDHGYRHSVTLIKRRSEKSPELLPRAHRVISLLKRWLLGTHQGAVGIDRLQEYLDEFSFRFNRRKSRSRGKLFLPPCPASSRNRTNRLPQNRRLKQPPEATPPQPLGIT
jgi:transposase-like protein